MAQDQAIQFLTQGINAAKAGQKDQARQLFQNALRLDPQNETAWLWMSSVARDNRERLFCLQSLIQINPRNEMAIKGLKALGVDPASMQQAQTAAAVSSAPVQGGVAAPPLDKDHLNTVLVAADEFVRSYNPIPVLAQEIAWKQKRGGRYGEAAAIRRRATRIGAVAIVGIVALAIIAGVLFSLLSGGDGGPLSVSDRPTLTPSFTATFTPTSTPGVTNTPSPEPDNPEPTFQPPANLPRGSIYGGTATPVYPALSAELGGNLPQAVALYSIGNYPAAFGTLSAERQLNNITCYPETYYYQIIGLVEQGGRRNLEDAQALVAEALGNTLPGGCNTSPLVYTGACYTDYVQGIENNEPTLLETSRTWCEAALDELGAAPAIPLASMTLARIHLLAGDFPAARAALDNALRSWGGDVNLLLLRAEVEIQAGDLSTALEYISRALYVDPVAEESLALRVEAFLRVAAQTTEPQEQIRLYGTAVLWSQEYLLYYPGDPQGYLLLAKARYGEGNIQLAEEALNRIISNEGTLPPTAQPVIREAYALRAQIYTQTARYEPALEDVQFLLQATPDDPALIEQQATLAYQLKRYPLAVEGLNTLLALDSTRSDLQLIRLQLTTEVCSFDDAIGCDYQTAFDTLTDDFIEALPPEIQPQARAYRGIAHYHLTQAAPEGTFSASQLTREYENALEDIDAALLVDQNPVNVYYQGLLQEGLENPAAALISYNWIAYWSQFYNYPFTEQVQARIEELQSAVEEEAES